MAYSKISQYGLGFTQGVLIRGLPVNQVHPGRVFWVNNSTVLPDGGIGGSNGNDGTYLRPFSTIDYAVGRCTANRGDIIMVMPGYTQTISAAAGIALDVAGIAVIGLGMGSLRPTITFATADTASITVGAANISVQNMLFVANIAACATCFDVGAAKDFTVEYCEFRDTSSSLNFINVIDTNAVANDADGLYFCNNRILGLGTTAATTAIDIDEACDRIRANDNYIVMAAVNNTPALLDIAAFNVLSLEVARNIVYRPNTDSATGGLLLEGTTTASTGMVYENHVKSLDVAGMLIMTTGSVLGFHENYLSGTADTSGIIIPAADSDAS